MSIAPILVALLFPSSPLDAESAVRRDVQIQMSVAHQSTATSVPIMLSMGPDPGGKTGATVNSETTKTGQPSVDNATSRNSPSTNAAESAEHGSAQSHG